MANDYFERLKTMQEDPAGEEPEIIEDTDPMDPKETLKAFLVAIVITGLLLGAVGFIFFTTVQFALGVLLGVLTACGTAVHLYASLDKSLDMPADKAGNYQRSRAMLRLLIMGLPILIACLLPNVFHVLGVLLGITGLKLGAYLQPVTLKAIKYFKRR